MTRIKKAKINFFDIVKDDLVFLRKSLHSLIPSLIGNVIVHCDDSTKRFIGYNIGIITTENYSEKLDDISDGCKYTFSLFDGSLVCIYYCFDNIGTLLSFSLSFLPNCESDVLFKENILAYRGEYYIRIDFEPDSFIENTHSKVHMHTTLFKKGLRIPADRIVLPSEFLFFILKRVYGENDLEGLHAYISSISKKADLHGQLTIDECSTFFLNY